MVVVRNEAMNFYWKRAKCTKIKSMNKIYIKIEDLINIHSILTKNKREKNNYFLIYFNFKLKHDTYTNGNRVTEDEERIICSFSFI
jgi:phage FluMu protein Com